MKNIVPAFLVVATATMLVAAPRCLAQSLLNQSSDELLQGFDIDPAVLNQYPAKPAASSTKGLLFKLIGAALPSISVDASGSAPNIRVKAPFVNVNVSGSERLLQVETPLVRIETGPGPSVRAPVADLPNPVQPSQ